MKKWKGLAILAVVLTVAVFGTGIVPAEAQIEKTTRKTEGDLSGNGVLGAEDALYALQITVQLRESTMRDQVFGDVNADGKVDEEDALYILKKVVGLDDGYIIFGPPPSLQDMERESLPEYMELLQNHFWARRDGHGRLAYDKEGTKCYRFEEKCWKEEEGACRLGSMENAPVDAVVSDFAVCDFDGDGEAELLLFDIDKTNRVYVCRKDRTQGTYSWDTPIDTPVYFKNSIAYVDGRSMRTDSLCWEMGDDKILCSVSEDTDYVPGEVVIVIKKEYSGLNKTYSQKDFPGVGIKEIEYLTSLRESAEGTLIDLANFRQILLLRLTDESKQGVRDAVAVLNRNWIVYSADPNYKFVISPCENR